MPVSTLAMELAGVILIMAILSFGEVVNSDLASDGRALMAFRAAVGRHSLKWNPSVNVCNWRGIGCSRFRVIWVRLPGARLVGRIPRGSLGNLTELQKLSLRHNSLQGSIPEDLSNCKALKIVNLQGNQMSGPLPSEWPNLTALTLSFNDFNGTIPASLSALKRLRTLLLDNNSFTGPLPVLDLPSLVDFNVSNNNLTGPVPDTLKKFAPDSFLGNNLSGELQLQPGSGLRKKHRVGKIFGIVVGGVCLTGLIVAILVISWGKKKPVTPDNNEDEKSTSEDDYSISLLELEKIENSLVFSPDNKHSFSFEDLLRASAEVLGKGSVGVAYKAILRLGTVLVVKRATEVVVEPRKFIQQINRMAKMSHKNLLSLKAYYCSQEEKLLVYDYMPMGSLYSLLHGNRGAGRTPVDWDTRVQIALGAAEGIDYLHKQGGKVSHGNIKSSNILLTNDYNACLSDFGLAHVLTASSTFGNKVGYRAPEVSDIHMVSQKADVYSFGVLLLELVTGKSPTQVSLSDEGLDLPTWVQSAVPEEWTAEVSDLESTTCRSIEEEMLQLLQVGMACVALYPDQRPTMTQIVKMIRDIYSKSGEPGPTTKPPSL